MRKEKDFNVTDNIKVTYACDDDLAAAINSFEDKIKGEVLALELERVDDLASEAIDLNDKEAKVEIERL